jgi:hypothetical protein
MEARIFGEGLAWRTSLTANDKTGVCECSSQWLRLYARRGRKSRMDGGGGPYLLRARRIAPVRREKSKHPRTRRHARTSAERFAGRDRESKLSQGL